MMTNSFKNIQKFLNTTEQYMNIPIDDINIQNITLELDTLNRNKTQSSVVIKKEDTKKKPRI